MSGRSILLLLVIAVFGVISTLALMDVGYFGIIKPHFQSWGQAQVFADLVILGVLACFWIVKDAREQGMAAWPFVAATLVLGSFGPLIYLVARDLRSAGARPGLARH
jgi:cytochrome bd-type quinol oxidase subunit 2